MDLVYFEFPYQVALSVKFYLVYDTEYLYFKLSNLYAIQYTLKIPENSLHDIQYGTERHTDSGPCNADLCTLSVEILPIRNNLRTWKNIAHHSQ